MYQMQIIIFKIQTSIKKIKIKSLHFKHLVFPLKFFENPYTNRKFKNELTTQKRHQNFDYTTIVDWLGIVSWSNNSHPAVVVKPVYGTQPSH